MLQNNDKRETSIQRRICYNVDIMKSGKSTLCGGATVQINIMKKGTSEKTRYIEKNVISNNIILRVYLYHGARQHC